MYSYPAVRIDSNKKIAAAPNANHLVLAFTTTYSNEVEHFFSFSFFINLSTIERKKNVICMIAIYGNDSPTING